LDASTLTMDGALLVDKPAGLTSHDVVARVRKVLGTSRIGHTGTLDPAATGLLVLLAGRATRLSQFLVLDFKEYIADIRLGVSTPTYDADSRNEGTLMPMPEDFTVDAVEGVLPEFRGTYWQVPPPFSAKKIAGTRAYELARRNLHVELKPAQVTAREIEILHYVADGLVRLRVACSAGFYVRSLAHDLGQRLGCGAHLESLRRTKAGPFTILDAAPLEELEAEPDRAAARIVGMNDVLAELPALTLVEEGVRRASHGNAVAPHQVVGGFSAAAAHPRVRLLDRDGALLAVAEQAPDALLHPVVVLV
jgi:tRNA pseudouridine55 synthase